MTFIAQGVKGSAILKPESKWCSLAQRRAYLITVVSFISFGRYRTAAALRRQLLSDTHVLNIVPDVASRKLLGNGENLSDSNDSPEKIICRSHSRIIRICGVIRPGRQTSKVL